MFLQTSSAHDAPPGRLYVVATPIGNLDDMTRRAVAILAAVDVVAAEDTRHTQSLLSHFGLQKTLCSLHQHNERARVDYLKELLAEGKTVALVSDAGTPLISDPGATLVTELRAAGHIVIPVPGACALIAALSASGLPTDRFIFEGFLPAKSSNRRAALQKLVTEQRTLVFYEAPHRIQDMMADCAEIFGADREVCVGRELTKTFETFISGTAKAVVDAIAADHNQTRGEFVVMIKGAEAEAPSDDLSAATIDLLALLGSLKSKISPSDLASAVAAASPLKKRDIYKQILALD
ncbi:16S rRNA (cytidine(1402)-2'-O)-methyltransferase [Allohahella sp. A8]|uniref:16S rRNA (cytidine(1402)-2'-O)-methyltransferase n=1 Tax=Allohahella sp. A8 TaxID=3141461 RepID=UPI000C095702|nr:16S rRNA (cytidine(1402)-2'-O)-methyltransferase [Hahellaceae bacterium]|tara:strand:+ start:9592 stop:10470 length:879 start_codon:yes stop_codon:yes gene_type:complete